MDDDGLLCRDKVVHLLAVKIDVLAQHFVAESAAENVGAPATAKYLLRRAITDDPRRREFEKRRPVQCR
ncbi:hypothetical protein DF186_23075, partial [Enterococcus hirae]